MRLVHVAQGLFGAPSPKPTTLLVLRLFDLERNLHKGMLSTQMAEGTSVGKDASGQFNTAPLKEYLPGFCKAIAQSFCTHLCTDSTSIEYGALPELPPVFFDLCNKMRYGEYIGKDWSVCPHRIQRNAATYAFR